VRIAGAGFCIPEKEISSSEIETRLGLEPGWIARRTGIEKRPIASAEDATSDLAARAGTAALRAASIEAGSIGLVLLATSTPDHLLPPTAPLVAHRLGIRGGALDLAGACSGFLYALILGSHWVDASGKAALVVGANILSRRLNSDDSATVALFSDGAGAVVLSPSTPTALLGSFLGSDGSHYEDIGITGGGTREPLTPESLRSGANLMTVRRGSALFKHAVQGMAEAGKGALHQAGLSSADIDWWIPHQANTRIIQEAGALLEIASERTINVVAQYGNSSAATIPIAITDAERKFKPGDKILMTAAGAGLVTAAAVVRWHD
jgi:3-oxoacyl-[acyl-carrier-protein] synthase-3